MTYNTITPPIFTLNTIQESLHFLELNGYVVLSNILDSSQTTEFIDYFKQDIKTISPNFDMNDSSTWNIANFPGMFGKGMCVFNGIGQSNFMWYLRTNKKILDIFKKIYKTDELVTSFDGCSLFCSNKQQSKSWHHIDQNPKNKIESYQSSYNYYPVTEKSSGFVIAPKSHTEFKPDVKHNKDWIMLDKDNEWHSKVVKLLIPENCLTIWNSKTIHANSGMHKKFINTNLDRLTCYITYLPKILRKEETMRKRIQGYYDGITTSHWANKYEPKKYPYGFKKQYENKCLGNIQPLLSNKDKDKDKDTNKNIPIDRLNLI